jgi:hypothetical protein
MGVFDRTEVEEEMTDDDESRAADEMTTEELLARAERGTPVEGARQPPKSRKREDFAQRMHAVMGQTIAKSEAELSPIAPIVSTPESRTRHIKRRASRDART